MKITFTTLVVLLTSSVLMAADQKIKKTIEGGVCSSMAKYGAIKLFKANQGYEEPSISYSGEIDARAFLNKTEKSGLLTYSVSVDEAANEGADDFTVSSIFIVKVRSLGPQASKCRVLSVSEVENL